MPYIFPDARVSQTLVGHVLDFASVVERFDVGAAMIFPIQPPLMERDDKAATVIIAVVYGAPTVPSVCRLSFVYRARALFSPLLSFLPFPFRCSRFYFSPVSTFARANENIFVVSQIRSGDIPMTRNDLLTTAT